MSPGPHGGEFSAGARRLRPRSACGTRPQGPPSVVVNSECRTEAGLFNGLPDRGPERLLERICRSYKAVVLGRLRQVDLSPVNDARPVVVRGDGLLLLKQNPSSPARDAVRCAN